MKALDRFIGAALRWLSVACLLVLFGLLSAVVLTRFVPVMSMGWSDEIVELGFAWLVFLGAAALARDGTHFRVDLLPRMLEGTAAGRALEIALGLLALGFFAVFTYEALALTRLANDRSPIFALPRALWYGVMPVAGVLMSVYTLRDLWRRVRGTYPRPGDPPR